MTINRRQFLQGRRRRGRRPRARSARRRSRRSRPRSRSATCTRSPSTARSGSASIAAASQKNGVELEFDQFTTGLELFQAMIGGSLDMLATGAVISNFPARGQGKMFLINDVEFATAQLWVREDKGIKSVRRPQGQEDLDHDRHHRARVPRHRAARQRPRSAKDVEIVNQRMAEAVTSFISGAVPAVALWVPFNITVRDKVPGAKKLVDASAYYPQAAIVGGWAARNDYYAQEPRRLRAIIRGWAEANDYLIGADRRGARRPAEEALPAGAVARPQGAVQGVEDVHVDGVAKLYADGTVTKWLQQVTDFFVTLRQASRTRCRRRKYFDAEALPRHDARHEGACRSRRMDTTTSSSAPARRAACSPTGCRRIRACACCCSRRAAPTATSGCSLPVGYFRTIYDTRFSRLFDTEPSEGTARTQRRVAARPRARRLVVDQRADLHPRPARGLRRLGGAGRAGLGLSRRCCRSSSASSATRRRERVPRRARRARRLGPAQRPSVLRRLGRGAARSWACRSTPTSTARRRTASAPTS